jgi:hypothetical protein
MIPENLKFIKVFYKLFIIRIKYQALNQTSLDLETLNLESIIESYNSRPCKFDFILETDWTSSQEREFFIVGPSIFLASKKLKSIFSIDKANISQHFLLDKFVSGQGL